MERLLTGPNGWKKIAKNYAKLMDCTESQLYFSLRTHITNRHKPADVIIVPQGERRASVESFAQKLLDIGQARIDTDPSKVQIKDVISAQKLLIEKSKLKLGEASLMLNMAKMFGGFGEPEPIEGEEIHVDPADK
jgi:hypothetical protein